MPIELGHMAEAADAEETAEAERDDDLDPALIGQRFDRLGVRDAVCACVPFIEERDLVGNARTVGAHMRVTESGAPAPDGPCPAPHRRKDQ